MRQPGGRVDDELDAYQAQSVPGWLVYQCFWLRGIDLAVAHERAVHVVDAHRAVVGTADAVEEPPVAGGGGSVDVDELPRRVANGLNESGRGSGGQLVTGLSVGGIVGGRGGDGEKRRGRSQNGPPPQQKKAQARPPSCRPRFLLAI